ncbi:hypothetical protein [Oricola sp.]|uniref:hypothetical protein n=1 Tax=Oricola sp. TaxID=1979950 RepID=UPI003BAC9C89
MGQSARALLTSGLAALTVAGCAGGNAIDRAVPQAAFSQPVDSSQQQSGATAQTANASAPSEEQREILPPTATADPVFSGSGQIADTGQFPSHIAQPRGATEQMTDEKRDALLEQMQALSVAQQRGRMSTAEYQRRVAALRRLANTHSADTIEKIEENAASQ